MKTTKGFFLICLAADHFPMKLVLANFAQQVTPNGHVDQIERSGKHFSQIRCFYPKQIRMKWPDVVYILLWCILAFLLLGLVILQLDMLVSVSKVQCASIGILKPIIFFSCRIGVDKLVEMKEFKCSSPNSFLFTHVMSALLLVLAQA